MFEFTLCDPEATKERNGPNDNASRSTRKKRMEFIGLVGPLVAWQWDLCCHSVPVCVCIVVIGIRNGLLTCKRKRNERNRNNATKYAICFLCPIFSEWECVAVVRIQQKQCTTMTLNVYFKMTTNRIPICCSCIYINMSREWKAFAIRNESTILCLRRDHSLRSTDNDNEEDIRCDIWHMLFAGINSVNRMKRVAEHEILGAKMETA